MATKVAFQPDPAFFHQEILDAETYNQRLSKLQIEIDVILSQKPFNNLKVNKSKIHLYELLKRHNEKKSISTDELPRTQYRLAQMGVKWNQIEQDLAMEKFKIEKKNEEIIHDKPSVFAVNLKNEQSLSEYLEKNLSFQLFNKVDSVTNNAQRQINSHHREFMFETYMDKNIENRKQMQLQKKNFTFYKKSDNFQDNFQAGSRMSSKEQLSIKQGFLVMDPKQRIYFEAFSKYIQTKYILLNSHPEIKQEYSLPRLINEFFEITTSHDVKSLWQILYYHVEVCEEFYKKNPEFYEFFEDFKQNPQPFRPQKSPNPLYGKNLINLFFSSQKMLQRGILNRSCEILEEEFYENLQKVENSSISLRSFANLDTNTSKLLMPILNFIEKNYLLTEFRRKPQNYIELDDYQTPIWAIFFVLVRSGMNKMISKLVGCYKGRTKVKEFGEFFEKYLIAQNENKELESVDRKEAMELIINSNETIDVFQYSLYIIITKHCEIISMELISQIGDYLWFNLKLCDFHEENSSKMIENRKSMCLEEFQENFLTHCSQNNTNRNPLIDLKPLFLILCYAEALNAFKSYESYFNDFVHILIIIRESGLIIDFLEEKCNQLDLKEILYQYVRNFMGSRPLEAFYYFRILPKKDMLSLISNCIVNNDLLKFFFDSSSEAKINCQKLFELLGGENFKDLITDIIKNIKGKNLEMALKLFDLIKDYDKVLSLIIEYETEKILSLPKKTHSTLSKDKQTSLQNTINSLLSTYKASGKLDSCKESYQIIMLLNYLVQIRVILDNTNNDRRFEESYKKIKDWKLIPLKEEDNEQFRDFYITMNYRKSCRIYLELLIITLEILRELASQRSKITKPLYSREELKSVSSNLFNFFHKHLENIEIHDLDEKETLKKLNEEANQTLIMF